MIEERIRLLEERENLYKFEENLNENNLKKTIHEEDLFIEREDNFVKLREINMKIRKEVEKKSSKIDESLIEDKNIMCLIDKQNKNTSNSMNIEGRASKNNSHFQKDEPKKQETNFLNNNKFRNSVLQIKMNKSNNISVFNNAYNKDIMNEFGNKFNVNEENKNFGNPELKHTEAQKNLFTNIVNNQKPNNASQMSNVSTSLNKFFSQRNVDLNRPSPNKVFFFGLKK